MTVTLSPTVFDVDGGVTIPLGPGSDLRTFTRRIQRSATLDGGAVVVDNGYSPADRTFTIDLQKLTKEQFDRVAEMVRDYGELVAATSEGVFHVTPQRISESGKSMTLLVIASDT